MFELIGMGLLNLRRESEAEQGRHEAAVRKANDALKGDYLRGILSAEQVQHRQNLSWIADRYTKTFHAAVNVLRWWADEQVSDIDITALSALDTVKGMSLSAPELKALNRRYGSTVWGSDKISDLAAENDLADMFPHYSVNDVYLSLDQLQKDLDDAVMIGTMENPGPPEQVAAERLFNLENYGQYFARKHPVLTLNGWEKPLHDMISDAYSDYHLGADKRREKVAKDVEDMGLLDIIPEDTTNTRFGSLRIAAEALLKKR